MTRSEIEMRLKGVKRSGKNSSARCPGHDDEHASLSLSDGADGRVLLTCHAGCDVESVLREIGLETKDLFPSNGYHSPTNVQTRKRQSRNASDSCTLAAYAAAKGLSVSFLQKLGLVDSVYAGRPAIAIPYLDKNGNKTAVRYRLQLGKGEGKDDRFRWRTGDKVSLYGLSFQHGNSTFSLLVEGESDTQTGLQAGLQTLGIPGANLWDDERDAVHFDGVETVYVIEEPDKGGETLVSHLSRSRLLDKATVVRFSDAKDLNEFYRKGPDDFLSRWQAEAAKAVPLRTIVEAKAKELWSACRELAEAPDILQRFADVIKLQVTGENRAVRLLFLAFVSRFLRRPVSIVLKGSSSAGKSYVTKEVSLFFPQSAWYALTGGSEKALVYSTEPLKHRMFIIYEVAGLSSDFASYCLRSLLSEGEIRYETVVKTKDGPKGLLITREGPTGCILTTTSVSLHSENETRLLSVPIDDSSDQTKHIFQKIAAGGDEAAIDYKEWHALSDWLEQVGERRVVIPFAKALADKIPPLATRMRRDFTTLLSLIKSHALLHQASRERDSQGRVCATIAEDFANVRGLFADLLAQGVSASIPKSVRETVAAVDELGGYTTKKPVSYSLIARKLKLDVSTVWRRVQTAIALGFLDNLETREKQQAKIVTTDNELPDDVELLPTPEGLQVCAFAGGGMPQTHFETDEDVEAGEREAIRAEGCGDSRYPYTEVI